MDIQEAVKVTPHPRQLAWQALEFYGFIHFGMNTYTDSEWGDGRTSVSQFSASQLDISDWIGTMKQAGMRAVILTCKHHDGFCLWPSQYTDYTVANSGYQADIVAQVASEARRQGLKFGVYLSPWDRHESTYGSGKAYDDYYVNQLTELLTQYGELFCVWLDGACGEGDNGRKQVYDWARYYDTIRHYQPQAVISVAGPDVRWCGNEAGHARQSEWSVVPSSLQSAELTQSISQQTDDPEFSRRVQSGDEDLGSRSAIASADSLCWFPCEVDTSMRIGWFYHSSDDSQVRQAADLFDIYLKSVGQNSNLLLNVAPRPDGTLHPQDRQVLLDLGQKITDFEARHTTDFQVACSSGTYQPGRTWQASPLDVWPSLILTLPKEMMISGLDLAEDLTDSQRVESFEVYCRSAHTWKLVASATTIGARRIVTWPAYHTRQLKIIFTSSRGYPTLKKLACIKADTE